jgi:hypothetical protein
MTATITYTDGLTLPTAGNTVSAIDPAYVVRCSAAVLVGGVARPGGSAASRDEVILVRSADGPHAIRSQSSSAINIRR